MKPSILLLCITALSLPQIAFSQQRIYLDKDGEKVDSTAQFSKYYELTAQPKGGTYVKEYDEENRLRSEGAFSLFTEERRTEEGLHRNYRMETEELWYIEEYESGRLKKRETYYPGGKVKRQEKYKNGKFKKGKCFTESGAKTQFTPFFTEPQFPGGEKALLRYLADNIKYPALARENNIQGQVVMTFVIPQDGTVSDIRMVKDIGAGCGKEALRVVQAMPKWLPGRIDDVPVKVRYTLPIRFRLE